MKQNDEETFDEKKNNEITLLQQTVTDLGNQNENMKITIDMQEAELNDKTTQIETKEQEGMGVRKYLEKEVIESLMMEGDWEEVNDVQVWNLCEDNSMSDGHKAIGSLLSCK